MTKSEDVLRTLPMFQGLSKVELRKLERLMTPVDIKAGRQIIVEGRPGREAFLVLEGRATVRKGNKVVASVGPGDFIGEMAVLANLPRSASITADTDMALEVLDRRELVSLLEAMPKLTMKIMIAAIRHAHGLEASLTS